MKKIFFEKLNSYENDNINIWLSALDDTSRERMISRLEKADNNIKSFYWEAAVGFLLKKAGFDIEYEKKINNKTPDWFISKNDNHFILEVVTLLETQKVRDAVDNGEVFEVPVKKLEEAIIRKKSNSKHFDDPFIVFCVIGDASSGVNCNCMDDILNGHQYFVTTDYKKMEGRRADITPELKDDNIYCYYCSQYFSDFWSITPYVFNNSKFNYDFELFKILDSFNGKSNLEIYNL